MVGGWNATNRLVVGPQREARAEDSTRYFRRERAALEPAHQLHLDALARLVVLPWRPGPGGDHARRGERRSDAARLRRSTRSCRRIPRSSSWPKASSSPRDRCGCATAATCCSAIRTPTPCTNTSRADNGPAALSVFRKPSGYAGADIAEYGQPGSNGLTLDPQGRLTINEHGNRRVTRLEKDGVANRAGGPLSGQAAQQSERSGIPFGRRAVLHGSAIRPAEVLRRPAQGATVQRRVLASATGKLQLLIDRTDGSQRHRILPRREIPLRHQLGREEEGHHALRGACQTAPFRTGSRSST